MPAEASRPCQSETGAAGEKPSPLEPTITDKINDHLGAIGIGLAALLAAVAALVVARRRKDAPPPPEDIAPVVEPEAPVAPAAGLAPEDQQSEASNHLFGTGAAAAGVAAAAGASMLDANETDPVAEADVYIAYGPRWPGEDIPRKPCASTRNAMRPA